MNTNKINERIIEIENIIEVDMREKEIALLKEKYSLEYRYHGLNERDEAIHDRIIEIENYLEGEYRDEIDALYEEKYELYRKLNNN